MECALGIRNFGSSYHAVSSLLSFSLEIEISWTGFIPAKGGTDELTHSQTVMHAQLQNQSGAVRAGRSRKPGTGCQNAGVIRMRGDLNS